MVRRGSDKELKIDVKILDEKLSWGRQKVKVTPKAGSGEIWVNKDLLIK